MKRTGLAHGPSGESDIEVAYPDLASNSVAELVE